MVGKVSITLVIVTFVGVCNGMTSTMKPSRPPREFETFSFVYDPHEHILSVSERYHGTKQCFLLLLSPEEQVMVHKDDGMTQLQLKLITHLNTATKTEMTADELATKSQRLAHNCAHATAIYTLSI